MGPLGALDYGRHAFRAFLWPFSELVGDSDEDEQAIHAFLEELRVHVFGSAGEEKVELDALAVDKPFRGLFGFEGEVMIAGTDFHLKGFNLDNMSLGLGRLGFLAFVVRELAIVLDFADWRDCVRRNLDKVEAKLLRLEKGVAHAHYAEILALRADYAHFGRLDLEIYSSP